MNFRSAACVVSSALAFTWACSSGKSPGAQGTAGTGAVLTDDPNAVNHTTTPIGQCDSGCLIEGRCYLDGNSNPNNSCLHCDPPSNVTGWTPKADGGSCSDGLDCTIDDRCQAGACTGTALACSDGRDCTVGDHCEEGQGCVAGVSVCTAPSTCQVTGACGVCTGNQCTIAGSCFANMVVNPSNPCLVCDASRSQTAWSPLTDGTSCDDKKACTLTDVCVQGVCQGAPKADCDDGIFCNGQEQCVESGGTCQVVPGTSPCSVGCIEAEKRCATANCPSPAAGCACAVTEGPTCVGAAQKQRLACQSGVWTASAACDATANCLSSTGQCAPISSECRSRAPGTKVCIDGSLYACGNDLTQSDVTLVMNCDAGCEEQTGQARCVPIDTSVHLGQVWPPSNTAGRALLVVGTNFTSVTAIRIGGATAPVVSKDLSVPAAHKLVAVVPIDAPVGLTDLRFLANGVLTPSLPFSVAGSLPTGPARGPETPYGITALEPNPNPDPDPLYPPIDNFWVNECDSSDSYFLALDTVDGNHRNFVNVQGQDPPTPTITGFLESDTGLFHMTVTRQTPVSYVGTYSGTGESGVFRVVLFPENGPGRQLVLSVNTTSDTPVLDPGTCTN